MERSEADVDSCSRLKKISEKPQETVIESFFSKVTGLSKLTMEQIYRRCFFRFLQNGPE